MTNALGKVTSRIFNGVECDNAVIATFIDHNKAFDTVDHEIIVQKHEHDGIRSISINYQLYYVAENNM